MDGGDSGMGEVVGAYEVDGVAPSLARELIDKAALSHPVLGPLYAAGARPAPPVREGMDLPGEGGLATVEGDPGGPHRTLPTRTSSTTRTVPTLDPTGAHSGGGGGGAGTVGAYPYLIPTRFGFGPPVTYPGMLDSVNYQPWTSAYWDATGLTPTGLMEYAYPGPGTMTAPSGGTRGYLPTSGSHLPTGSHLAPTTTLEVETPPTTSTTTPPTTSSSPAPDPGDRDHDVRTTRHEEPPPKAAPKVEVEVVDVTGPRGPATGHVSDPRTRGTPDPTTHVSRTYRPITDVEVIKPTVDPISGIPSGGTTHVTRWEGGLHGGEVTRDIRTGAIVSDRSHRDTFGWGDGHDFGEAWGGESVASRGGKGGPF